ncbi:ATP-binding protein [Desertivirga xinjiangensis]|uniref:ATP-binding protein n=1 Tax=Desertivirga xinjiangensis TaxID=539206 RepID=UPI00210EB859
MRIDLSNCATEPIHIPGAVQTCGFLVVAQSSSNIITYVSSNILDHLNIAAGELLGRGLNTLEKYLSRDGSDSPLMTLVEAARKNETQTRAISFNGKSLDLSLYIHQEYIYLEFELLEEQNSIDIHNEVGKDISFILAVDNLPDILNYSVEKVKGIIGFDRVMIYQFLEDAHGKVIAEAKEEDLDPFLHLHYPASDIPEQARNLYKINKVRLIADVNSSVSAILSFLNEPIDLTYSSIRSVSPMHIQYLKNMGVASSFSISLICKGKLWGLIACHNYTAKHISRKIREAALLFGQVVSSLIEFKEEEIANIEQKKYKAEFDHIVSKLRREEGILQAVLSSSGSFKNIVRAGGAYLVYEGNVVKDGNVPSDEQISGIINWLAKTQVDPVFYTTKLSEFIPEAKEYVDVASGILACALSKELKEYIIWFKPEYVQSIAWAGNPDKPVEPGPDGEFSISPRRSFEEFKKILKETSEAWTVYEQNKAVRFKEELLYVINKKASEVRILNERLKEAYQELEMFSSTISHDLKTPLTVIKGYAQLLERNKSLNEDGRGFAARISVGITRMNTLIAEVLDYSRVGRSETQFQLINMNELLGAIKKEIVLAFRHPDLILNVNQTPDIHGDRTMLYQVFANLINNAVKYSRLSNPPTVTVEGFGGEFETLYRVQDNGIGIDTGDHSKVFELFKRVNVSSNYEGTGVGLAIVKRILEKHNASIWIENPEEGGTIFWINFRKLSH